jgi:hypothetical protein
MKAQLAKLRLDLNSVLSDRFHEIDPLKWIPVGLIQFGVIAVNALMIRQSIFLRKGWTRGSSPRVT